MARAGKWEFRAVAAGWGSYEDMITTMGLAIPSLALRRAQAPESTDSPRRLQDQMPPAAPPIGRWKLLSAGGKAMAFALAPVQVALP